MPKTDNICIIGAGPGGLATALALKEAGYSNVTVYEKTNRVGGQVFSKKYVTPEGKEIVYEQCAQQPIGSRYLNKIIKQYDLHYSEVRKIKLYSLLDQKLMFESSPKIFLNPYLWVDIVKLGYILLKHRRLWKPGFSELSETSELTILFEEWINRQQFRSAVDVLLRYSLRGFMVFHKPDKAVCACYGMKILMQCLHLPIRYINGELKKIKEGYQEIWVRVAKDLTVELNANISKIERTDNSITVTVNEKSLKFDKLIIACQEYAHFLDCTEDERIVNDARKVVGSVRAAFIAKNCPIESAAVFSDIIAGKRSYQCIGVTPYASFGDNLRLFTGSYVLPDEAIETKQKIIEATQEVLSVFGGELVEVISIHRQPEFGGYFSQQDIRQGMFKRSEARQGVKNTYYVGEMLSTGTNAVIVDYAYELVKKYF